jgi:hypothetical protein
MKMKILRTALVFVAGFVLGAAAYHLRTAPAPAHSPGILIMAVSGADYIDTDQMKGFPSSSPRRVVALSCVPARSVLGEDHCYVAIQ